MGLFDFFTKKDDDKERSSGRGTGGGASALDKVKTDISMGLSTFGQSKEQQAETLRDQGYSEKAIKSYQERTAASLERAQSMMSSSDDNGKPAPAPEPEPEAEPEVAAEPTVPDIVTEVPQPPAPRVVYVGGGGGSTRQPAKPDPVYKGRRIVPPSGRTEASAMEAGQRGRKSTIKTAPTGLLDQPELRRRSLMGGLIS